MASQRFPSNSNNSATVTQAGAEVVSPARGARMSGAGGGRISGSQTVFSVGGTPFLGPAPGGFPTPPSGLNTPLGNPNFPCAAGPEIMGLTSSSVPIDTGTGYYFRHRRTPAANNDMRFDTEFVPPAELQQHMVAFDYYGASLTPDGPDNAASYVEPVRYTLPINVVTLGGANAQVWNPLTDSVGTGTALQALQNAGGTVIRMDGTNPNTGYVDLSFDASQLSALLYNNATGTEGGRIVKLTLRYRAWRNSTADPAPGEGFSVYYTDQAYPVVGSLNLYLASWLVTDYQNNASTSTKSLGEVNFGARGYALDHNNGASSETWHAHPYTIEDLVTFMGAGQVFFGFVPVQGAGSNQRYLYLDYIELDVDVIPERRVSAAIRVVSNVYNTPTASPPQIFDSSASRASKVKWAPSSLALADLTPFPNYYFTLCVREALPIDSSDLLKVQPTLGLASLFEAIGPSLQLPAITQYQQTQNPQLQTFTATVINGQAKAKVLTPFEQYNLSVGAFSNGTLSAYWAGYRGLAIANRLEVWGYVIGSGNYGNAQLQRVWVQGGVTYTAMHMLAQPGPLTTAGLVTDLVDGTGTVVLSTQIATVASVAAMPDRGAGWRSFSMPLTTPYTPAVSGYVFLVAYSPTQEVNTWLLSSSASVGNASTYGYDVLGNSIFNEPSPGTYPAADAAYDNMVDRSMFLTCALATPPVPTTALVGVPTVGFACDVFAVGWYAVSWTPDATADKYALQVSTDFGTTWRTVKIVETFGSTIPQTIQDYGNPWDALFEYRLVAYRELDRQTVAGAATAPQSLSSVSAVLGFSTDSAAYLYSPTDPTAVEMQWTDLNAVTIVQFHGEQFNRALRENQDRGLRLSFQAVVANLQNCDSTIALSTAQRSLNPDGFATIQSLAHKDHITVRFPGGDVRTMTMELSGMTVRTSAGVYSVGITLTDVNQDGMTFTSDELFPVADI